MRLSNQYPSLKDKVVFISGGASGIGAGLVEAFCRQRAKVAFVDTLENEAAEFIERLGNMEGCYQPKFYFCNLIDIEKLQSIIEQVKTDLGPVSVLINNAADDARHDFAKVTREYWDERIAVNLRHAFFAIQAVHSHMKELGGGSVINFGSMSWHECQGNMTCYTTSKGGIEGMTRGLARELGADHIRINTLVPGWVMTDKQLKYRVDAATRTKIESSQCLKGRLLPEDIASMALFLASDDSKMCTAQNFIVDGGWI